MLLLLYIIRKVWRFSEHNAAGKQDLFVIPGLFSWITNKSNKEWLKSIVIFIFFVIQNHRIHTLGATTKCNAVFEILFVQYFNVSVFIAMIKALAVFNTQIIEMCIANSFQAIYSEDFAIAELFNNTA